VDVTNASDADMRENIGRFEAALEARDPELTEPPLGRILVALDGSNQDPTTEALAVALARRAGAEIVLVGVRDGAGVAGFTEYVQERAHRLGESGVDVAAVECLGAGDGDPPAHAQILSARERLGGDIIVLCAPFRDDFAELGTDSAGATLDVLLNRAPVPLLVAREPRDEPTQCFEHVILATTPFSPDVVDAAAWSLRVVDPEGLLRIVAIVDCETIEAASVLTDHFDAETMDEEMLAGLRRPAVAGLIAALQRHAAETHLDCRVSVRSGDCVAALAELANEGAALLATPASRDAGATSAARVAALVRAVRNPVLIVPPPGRVPLDKPVPDPSRVE
jgi:nucleotide-binding universal stress UspA family protein